MDVVHDRRLCAFPKMFDALPRGISTLEGDHHVTCPLRSPFLPLCDGVGLEDRRLVQIAVVKTARKGSKHVSLQILIRNRLDGKTQHERRIEYASRWLGVEGAKSVLEGKDGEPRGTLSSAYKDIMAGPISSARETERRFEEAQEREARRLGDSEKHKKGAKKGRKKDR